MKTTIKKITDLSQTEILQIQNALLISANDRLKKGYDRSSESDYNLAKELDKFLPKNLRFKTKKKC